MKKDILVVGPALSRSGYGEQTRFALRALRSREDIINTYIVPTSWGNTGWITDANEEREWIDSRISETVQRNNQMQQFLYDASIQVDVPWAPPPQGAPPNMETGWRKITECDIGYTAGVETNKVSPEWIDKSSIMKKIIVVSEHSRQVYADTIYLGTDPNTGRQLKLQTDTPIESVNFPTRNITPESLSFDLKYDYNFLTMAQWCPRKNLDNTIKWFVEEFHDDQVGLVVKANLMKNCLMDRNRTRKRLEELLSRYPDRTCSVHLIHGDMTDAEVQGLYTHPKIKAYISLSHGEGFGIPIFDAVCNGMPVITTAWSGPVDFLTMPKERKIIAARVDFSVSQIQPEAVWPGILQQDSMWCYPIESSAKKRMRDVFKRRNKYSGRALTLKKHVLENFSEEKMYNKFIKALPIDFNSSDETDDALSDIQAYM